LFLSCPLPTPRLQSNRISLAPLPDTVVRKRDVLVIAGGGSCMRSIVPMWQIRAMFGVVLRRCTRKPGRSASSLLLMVMNAMFDS